MKKLKNQHPVTVIERQALGTFKGVDETQADIAKWLEEIARRIRRKKLRITKVEIDHRTGIEQGSFRVWGGSVK